MPGPYLQAALICEKVLTEQDGTLTFIRILDKLWVQQEPTPDHAFSWVVTMVVLVKWGEFFDPITVQLALETPNGAQQPLGFAGPFYRTNVQPVDPTVGVNAIGQVIVPITMRGVHWLHVALNAPEVSRIPFTVEVGAPPPPRSTP